MIQRDSHRTVKGLISHLDQRQSHRKASDEEIGVLLLNRDDGTSTLEQLLSHCLKVSLVIPV